MRRERGRWREVEGTVAQGEIRRNKEGGEDWSAKQYRRETSPKYCKMPGKKRGGVQGALGKGGVGRDKGLTTDRVTGIKCEPPASARTLWRRRNQSSESRRSMMGVPDIVPKNAEAEGGRGQVGEEGRDTGSGVK
eukprot:CAMPEP_0184670988 /NCGR_PEP_ID=MMETSP0308-20130426/84849_1 /TAXON_ID=38269 /ORGANISM="Gloeochaete witrockiana, Strain SAG 46.84" /LENGTH=134 /DNA_ID=CAMNT_0027117973 /DNA_START=234 /DNA_END=639 /DNA_ORIENTATION=+